MSVLKEYKVVKMFFVLVFICFSVVKSEDVVFAIQEGDSKDFKLINVSLKCSP